MLLQLSQFFSPFLSLLPVTPPSPSSISPTPQFMSMGRTCKLFGFSISYTILNLPLTILCLPILLLIPCTPFPSTVCLLLPTDNPPCDLHFCDSAPVLIVCLVFVFLCSAVYYSFLIHSFTDGHLGCFQHLAIINSAAINIGVHRFF